MAGGDESTIPSYAAAKLSMPGLLTPQPGRVVIYFPLVGGQKSRLASLECSPWEHRTDRRYMLSHPEFSRQVEQILAGVRFNEDPDTSEKCVRIRFAPTDFTGTSYGLGLALADKLARFAPAQPICNGTIYATGQVVVDGHGAIGPVEDFPAKVRLIEQIAKPGSLFVFPRENAERADTELRHRLACLRLRGITCQDMGHIDEWQTLMFPETEPRPAPDESLVQTETAFWDWLKSSLAPLKRSLARRILQIAVLLLLAGVAVAVAVFYFLQPGDPIPPSVNVNVSYWYRSAGRGTPRTITEGGTLYTGDIYHIEFIPDKDGYLYILQDDSKRVECLFPLEHFRGMAVNNRNPVYAQRRYYVPAEGYSFELDYNVGQEAFYVFAAQESDRVLEGLCGELSDAYAQQDIKRLAAVQEKLRDSLRKSRLVPVSTLRFQHLAKD